MAIKPKELPQAASITAGDSLVASTERGTERMTLGQIGEFMKSLMESFVRSVSTAQWHASTGFEAGSVTVANSQGYPFNTGFATVALRTQRQNLNYVVSAELVTASGNVQSIEVYDKQLNGFKIRYDGSATAATIRYYVTGGM